MGKIFTFINMKKLVSQTLQLKANKSDMLELQKSVDGLNYVKLSARERSSTKWKFVFATNMTFHSFTEYRCC